MIFRVLVSGLACIGMTSDLQPSVTPNIGAALPELEALPALPTINQAAAAVGVSHNSIRRRISDGTLKAYPSKLTCPHPRWGGREESE